MAKKMQTIDGNTAAAHVAYAMSDVAALYPITPSSPMGEDRRRMGGQGAQEYLRTDHGRPADAIRSRRRRRGARLAGRRRPDHHLYRLPGPAADDPQHVQNFGRTAARRFFTCHGPGPRRPRPCPSSATTQDVMACRQTGFAHAVRSIRCRKSWTWPWWPICRPSSRACRFVHFFDGFRTSHEIQKIEMIDYEDMAKLVNHEAIAGLPGPGHEPRAPATARHGPESGHLFPGPRSGQPLLPESAGHRDRLHEKGRRTDRPALQPVRLRGPSRMPST